ncbi:MAG: hydrogenase maturation protease [Crenarchaeota archaeon]|nr:hydrogenase maturation protease [Thermoproteota archaeon]
MKIGIIGVGNVLFGDEGLGTLFVKCLEEVLKNEKVDLHPLGIEVLDILHILYMENYDIVILIDCGKIDKEYIIYEIRDDIEERIIENLINLETFSSHSESPIQILIKSIFLKENRPKVYILLFKPDRIDLLSPISERSLENLMKGFTKLLEILDLSEILDKFLKNVEYVKSCVIREFNLQYEYLQESH